MSRDVSRISWTERYNDPRAHRCPCGHYSKLINGAVVCDRCNTVTVNPQTDIPKPKRVEIVGGPETQGVEIVS